MYLFGLCPILATPKPFLKPQYLPHHISEIFWCLTCKISHYKKTKIHLPDRQPMIVEHWDILSRCAALFQYDWNIITMIISYEWQASDNYFHLKTALLLAVKLVKSSSFCSTQCLSIATSCIMPSCVSLIACCLWAMVLESMKTCLR